jgi:hypothetical protein
MDAKNAVYLIRDSVSGTILYVGRTKRDPATRVAEHLKMAAKLQGFRRSELVLAAYYDTLTWEVLEDEKDDAEARELERETVERNLPLGNTYLKPK